MLHKSSTCLIKINWFFKSRNLKKICLLLSWNEMAYRSHWEFFKKNIKLLSRRRRYILNSKPSDGLKNFGQQFHLGGNTCTHHGTLSDINFIKNFQNFILQSCSMFISRLTFGIDCLKRKKEKKKSTKNNWSNVKPMMMKLNPISLFNLKYYFQVVCQSEVTYLFCITLTNLTPE